MFPCKKLYLCDGFLIICICAVDVYVMRFNDVDCLSDKNAASFLMQQNILYLFHSLAAETAFCQMHFTSLQTHLRYPF